MSLGDDASRFARHGPILVGAAAGSVAAADIATAVLRVALPQSGLPERLLYLAAATIAGGVVLSLWFVGRAFSAPEWFAILVAASASLLLGYSVLGVIHTVAPDVPGSTDAQSIISVVDLAWLLATLLVLVPVEYWIWENYARIRIRLGYQDLDKTTRDVSADDRIASARVRKIIRHMERQETRQTTEVVAALRDWADLWLGGSHSSDPQSIRSAYERVDRAMSGLYGRNEPPP